MGRPGEDAAKAAGLDSLLKHPFKFNSRAQIVGSTDGMVKVIAKKNADGSAGEFLAYTWWVRVTEQLSGGYLAVNWEATVEEVAAFIQPHPSLSELFGETMLSMTGRSFKVDVRREDAFGDDMADVLPQLGETVTEGTITQWFKNIGDVVNADEPLFEVSTDKVDTGSSP